MIRSKSIFKALVDALVIIEVHSLFMTMAAVWAINHVRLERFKEHQFAALFTFFVAYNLGALVLDIIWAMIQEVLEIRRENRVPKPSIWQDEI